MLKRTFSLTFLLFIASFTLWGQEIFMDGYVIKHNGDTLKGMLNYKNKKVPSQVCEFKRFDIALKIKYTHEEIKAYGYKNGNHFELRDVNGEKIFVECLVKGKISLFSYGSRLFIEKNSRSFLELRTRPTSVYQANNEFTFANYKELLAAQTKDLADFTLPQNISLKAKKILPAIVTYNSMVNTPFKVYQRNYDRSVYRDAITHAEIKIHSYGIISSYSTNQLSQKAVMRNADIPEIFTRNQDLFFGAYYSRILFRNFKQFSLNGQVLIANKKKEYDQEYFREFPSEQQNFTINTNTTHFKFPIYIQYEHIPFRLTPYVNGGLCLNFRVVNNIKGLLKTTNAQNQTLTYSLNNNKYKETSNLLSAFVGIGIKQKMYNSIILSIESRIELMAYYHEVYPEILKNTHEYYEFFYLYSPIVDIVNYSPVFNIVVGIGLDQ
jgi:hypothetical protein